MGLRSPKPALFSGVAWFLVERRLPWISPWREWDRCARLRRAIVDQFLDRDLPLEEFGTAVDDDKLWSKVEIASNSSRGTAPSRSCEKETVR
ncbi:MAG TPA: hypothetical protein VIZ19_18410 [Roseiarcus sp.]